MVVGSRNLISSQTFWFDLTKISLGFFAEDTFNGLKTFLKIFLKVNLIQSHSIVIVIKSPNWILFDVFSKEKVCISILLRTFQQIFVSLLQFHSIDSQEWGNTIYRFTVKDDALPSLLSFMPCTLKMYPSCR